MPALWSTALDRPTAMHTPTPSPSPWNLLSAHHLLYQVQSLLERAESHVVLVTPYVDLWPSLELVMRQAVARGVTVHVVTRSKDETHFEEHKGRRTNSLDRIKALGATLHEVDWLHTKLYLNEKEAIISSFNLTATGRDGPNLGVHLHGAEAASQALLQVDQWLPGFLCEVCIRSTNGGKAVDGSAFCIRCQRVRPIFNMSKPYCCDCWQERRAEKHHKAEACCHRCGERAGTTLQHPTCDKCSVVPEPNTPSRCQLARIQQAAKQLSHVPHVLVSTKSN